MSRSTRLAILLAACAVAACRNDGGSDDAQQPTTLTGRPALAPQRRLICRLRESVDGENAARTGQTDIVKLDKVSSTEARVGDTLRLELKAATGTGYQWIFAGCEGDPADPKAPLTPQFNFRKGEGVIEPLEPGKPGGPAHWVFEFKAANAGSTTLHFMLVRPWEKDTKPADTRTLKVVVRAP